MALRIGPNVETELAEIWRYIADASESPTAADRLIDLLADRFFLLSQHPYLGRHRDDLRPGLRSIAVDSYVVIYRIEGLDVLILHVIHGRRDLQRLVGE